MDLKKMFEKLLKFSKEICIKEIQIDESNKVVNVYVEYIYELETGYKLHSSYKKKWEHLPLFEYKTYIHCQVPIFKKSDTNHFKKAIINFASGYSRHTLAYEEWILDKIKIHNCFSKVAKELGIFAKTVSSIYHKHVSKINETAIPITAKRIGIDETSTRKGHNYLTTFVDMDNKQIIDIQAGRGSEAIKLFIEKHPNPNEITDISMDMSPAFLSGVQTYLPQAKITFDKWHVLRNMYKHLDKLGKKADGFKVALSLQFGELKSIYYAKSEELFLQKLYFIADLSAEYMGKNKFKSYILRNAKGIANYANSKLNNGLLEGLNSKIQLLKRLARGFNSVASFSKMIRFSFAA